MGGIEKSEAPASSVSVSCPPFVRVYSLDLPRIKTGRANTIADALAETYVPFDPSRCDKPLDVPIVGDCCLVSFEAPRPATFSERIAAFRHMANDIFKHHLNPQHVYCCATEFGVDRRKVRMACSFYEKRLYAPYLKPLFDWVGKAGEESGLISRLPGSMRAGLCPVPIPVWNRDGLALR